MTDIASLGIRVTTDGVTQATQQLGALEKSARTAAPAVKSVSDEWQKNTFSPQKLFSANKALADYKRGLLEAANATSAGSASQARLNAGLERENGVRERLAKLLATERGQRLLNAGATDRQAAGIGKAGAAMGGAALSAKQLQQATRGLPAQFTDIATSLASGQRPLQVLMQQGGQIKDVFGGIGPALRAVGGYLVGLINPLTVSAGLFATLFLAWKQGSDEAVAFNRALALTGNYAGTTTAQLEAMSVALTDSNTTQRDAAKALAAVTQSGKFTADQLQAVTQAAIDLQTATGQAVEDTVRQFASLADDPVRAVQTLNDKYHFLTAAVYDQIKALQAQGKQQEAATLAVEEFSRVSSERARQAVESAGWIERAWRGLGVTIRSVWSDILSIGRQSSQQAEAQLKIQSAVSQLRANASLLQAASERAKSGGAGFTQDQIALFRKDTERLKKIIVENQRKLANDPEIKRAQTEAATQRANDAVIAVKQLTDAHATAEQQRAKRVKEEIGKADQAIIAAQQSGNADLIAQAKAARAALLKAQQDDAASTPVATGGGRVRSGGRAPAARELPDFSKGASADLDRLAAAEARATQSFLDMQAALQGPLAEALREHNKRVQELNDLASQSPVAAAGLNDALALESKRYEDLAKSIEAAQDPLKLLLDDMRFELDTIGKSNAERAVMVELRRQNIDAMSAEGQAALATARQFEDEAKAKQRSIDLMDDFRQGAADALADFVTGAKSAKEAFADFFDDLARRITQMIAERWIEKAFGPQGSNGGGTTGGGWIAALASIFANANGNAFQNGNVMAFANGGVFSSPTFFPTANGRTGLMGEAGPEAIVPLHRGPDGKLGIRMEREAAPQRNVTVQQAIYVTGTVTPYVAGQMQQEAARKQRIASARNG